MRRHPSPSSPARIVPILGLWLGTSLAAAPAGAMPLDPPADTPGVATEAPQQAPQEEPEQRPPPPSEPVGGFVVSGFGGSQFAASSSLHVGGALAYFFEPKAQVGFEFEAGLTFGPGGRVFHTHANLVLQAGARTSRIVPYITAGGGYVRADLDLPETIQTELGRLGVEIPRGSESAPAANLGGGVRYYLKEGASLRADYREFWVFRSGSGSFFERIFSLRRFAAMLSFDL